MYRTAAGDGERAGGVRAVNQEVNRYLIIADMYGIEKEKLDALVHELAAAEAAAVNNGGRDEQTRFIRERFSEPEFWAWISVEAGD